MAVNDVTLQLDPTGIAGLVGPNGSGKSTLFHLITGFYKLDGGAVYFKERRISGLSPHIISRMGIVRTFQQTRVLPFLTAQENLMAASPDQAGGRISLRLCGTVDRRERRYEQECKPRAVFRWRRSVGS